MKLGLVEHHLHEGLQELKAVVVVLAFVSVVRELRQYFVAVRVEHSQKVQDAVQVLEFGVPSVHIRLRVNGVALLRDSQSAGDVHGDVSAQNAADGHLSREEGESLGATEAVQPAQNEHKGFAGALFDDSELVVAAQAA